MRRACDRACERAAGKGHLLVTWPKFSGRAASATRRTGLSLRGARRGAHSSERDLAPGARGRQALHHSACSELERAPASIILARVVAVRVVARAIARAAAPERRPPPAAPRATHTRPPAAAARTGSAKQREATQPAGSDEERQDEECEDGQGQLPGAPALLVRQLHLWVDRTAERAGHPRIQSEHQQHDNRQRIRGRVVTRRGGGAWESRIAT